MAAKTERYAGVVRTKLWVEAFAGTREQAEKTLAVSLYTIKRGYTTTSISNDICFILTKYPGIQPAKKVSYPEDF